MSFDEMKKITRSLSRAVNKLSFSDPVEYVYNPLDYASGPHEEFLRRFGSGPRRVVLLGMNPGPFGMAQTGVPFGEIAAVRDWMGISGKVKKPSPEHPKRPVRGFDCARSEVSGARLWGLFKERFGTAEKFFAQHYVANYCPLVFMSSTGANVIPEKLSAEEREPLFEICDAHLARFLDVLEPEWVVGVGKFAEKKAKSILGDSDVRVGNVLHPSPASPQANKDWAGTAVKQFKEQGIWK